MDAVVAFWKACKGPLIRWWLRVGLWYLGIYLTALLAAMAAHNRLIQQPVPAMTAWDFLADPYYLQLVVDFGALCLWLAAARYVGTLILGLNENKDWREGEEAQACFVLGSLQGLPVIAVTVLAALLCSWLSVYDAAATQPYSVAYVLLLVPGLTMVALLSLLRPRIATPLLFVVAWRLIPLMCLILWDYDVNFGGSDELALYRPELTWLLGLCMLWAIAREIKLRNTPIAGLMIAILLLSVALYSTDYVLPDGLLREQQHETFMFFMRNLAHLSEGALHVPITGSPIAGVSYVVGYAVFLLFLVGMRPRPCNSQSQSPR